VQLATNSSLSTRHSTASTQAGEGAIVGEGAMQFLLKLFLGQAQLVDELLEAVKEGVSWKRVRPSEDQV
jgi:hypothetical protein